MYNSIIDFETRSVPGVISEIFGIDSDYEFVEDYFTKNITLYTFLSSYTSDIIKYRTHPNDNIERISNDLYGTPNYWDILLLINKFDPLFSTVMNDDSLIERVDTEVENYIKNVYFGNNVDEKTREKLRSDILKNYITQNDDRRTINVIRPSSMNRIITLLRKNGKISS